MSTLGQEQSEARLWPGGEAASPLPAASLQHQEVARSVFGEWLILREAAFAGGPLLGLRLPRVEDVTRALRGALLHHAEDPPPAVLSGHAADGSPLARPHVAFLALADLGSRAAGSICGAAIVLPRDIEPEDRQAVLLAAARWERSGLRLWLGRLGEMQFARVEDSGGLGPLHPATWVRPEHRWASVTPVALDRNPGDLLSADASVAARAALRAEEIVAEACTHIGLPRPAAVRILRCSRFHGIPLAASFMPYPRRGGGFKRVCVHVELRFDEPVTGPVLLGVGRHFGMGLCGPWSEGQA